jgi:hypothetical protein
MGNQRLQHPTMIIKASFNITYAYQCVQSQKTETNNLREWKKF